MLSALLALIFYSQVTLAPFAPPRELPDQLPDVSKWESVYGEALLCPTEMFGPLSVRRNLSVYRLLADGLRVCRTDTIEQPVATVRYIMYIAPSGYRGYAVIRFSLETIDRRPIRETVSWMKNGRTWINFSALVGKWYSADLNAELKQDIEFTNIWLLDLHYRLRTERDRGNLQNPGR